MLERLKGNRVVGVALATNRRFGGDGGGNMAAAVAYYGFLSLFPLMAVALSALGFVVADEASLEVWVARLSGQVPGLDPLIGENLRTVAQNRHAVGIIGLVGLAWTGSGVVRAGGVALNRVFRVPGYESFAMQKAWQFGSLAALGVLALAAAGVTASVGAVDLPGVAGVVVSGGGAGLALALDFALFLLAYRLLTQRRGPPFSELWPGALLAAGAWGGLKLLGGWYARRTVAGATAVYGTFAVVVGVLALLHLAARLFLYGAELNAVLIEEKGGGPMGDRGEDRTASPGDGHRRARTKSTPELVASIAGDAAALARKEVELAKQEVVESVTARLKAAGALAAAGLLALFALLWLSAALAWALDGVMRPWASRLVVAGVFVLLAAVAAAFARTRGRKAPLEETKRTVKEDVEWARAQLRR